jgi:hypothetical protein
MIRDLVAAAALGLGIGATGATCGPNLLPPEKRPEDPLREQLHVDVTCFDNCRQTCDPATLREPARIRPDGIDRPSHKMLRKRVAPDLSIHAGIPIPAGSGDVRPPGRVF